MSKLSEKREALAKRKEAQKERIAKKSISGMTHKELKSLVDQSHLSHRDIERIISHVAAVLCCENNEVGNPYALEIRALNKCTHYIEY